MPSSPQIRSQRCLLHAVAPPPCGGFPLDGLGQLGRRAFAAPADAQLPEVIRAAPKPAGQFVAPREVGIEGGKVHGRESIPRIDVNATRVDHGLARGGYAPEMRTVNDIRRVRLEELIRDQFKANGAAFGTDFGVDRRQVSAWRRAPGKNGAKNISDTTARNIEKKYGRKRGWMDTDPAIQPAKASPAPASPAVRPDLPMIVGTVTLLSHYLELVGLPPEEIRDPVLLETAYAVAEEFGKPVSASNVLDLTKILAKRIRGAEDDGGQQAVRGARAAARG